MGSILPNQNSIDKTTVSQSPDQTSNHSPISSKRSRPDPLAELLPQAKRQHMNKGPANAICKAYQHSENTSTSTNNRQNEQNSVGKATATQTSDHAPDQTGKQISIFSKRPRTDSSTELPDAKRQHIHEGPANAIRRSHQHSTSTINQQNRKKLKQSAQGDAESSSSKEEVIKTPFNYTANESSSKAVANGEHINLDQLPPEIWLNCLRHLSLSYLDNFSKTCPKAKNMSNQIYIDLLNLYLECKAKEFLSSEDKNSYLKNNFLFPQIIKNIFNKNKSFFNSRNAIMASENFFAANGNDLGIDKNIIPYISILHKDYNVIEIRKLDSEKNINIDNLIKAGLLHTSSIQEKEELSKLLSKEHKKQILRILPLVCFQIEEIDIKSFLEIPPENIRKGIIQTYKESLTDPRQEYILNLIFESKMFTHDNLYPSHEGKVHPLLEFLNEEHLDFFKKLIKLGFNTNHPNKNDKRLGLGLLHLAIIYNFYKTADFLTKESHIDINSKDLYGRTPLNIAIEKKADLEAIYINEIIKFSKIFNIDLRKPPIHIEKNIKSNLTKKYKEALEVIKYHENLDPALYNESLLDNAIKEKRNLEDLYENFLKNIEIYRKNNELIDLLDKKHRNII